MFPIGHTTHILTLSKIHLPTPSKFPKKKSPNAPYPYANTFKPQYMTLSLIRFINLILAALLAGASFGIWAGLNPTAYSPATYLEQQQHLLRSLNTLMVSLVVAATLVTIASAWLQRGNKSVFVPLLIAAACFASCIFISRFGNLPIQNQMLGWTADRLPDNWASLRDQWWSFHIMRTLAELIALALVAWTASRTAGAAVS